MKRSEARPGIGTKTASSAARATARARRRGVGRVRRAPRAGREGAADENEERGDQQDTGGNGAKQFHVALRRSALSARWGVGRGESIRPWGPVTSYNASALERRERIFTLGCSMHGKCQAKTARYVQILKAGRWSAYSRAHGIGTSE